MPRATDVQEPWLKEKWEPNFTLQLGSLQTKSAQADAPTTSCCNSGQKAGAVKTPGDNAQATPVDCCAAGAALAPDSGATAAPAQLRERLAQELLLKHENLGVTGIRFDTVKGQVDLQVGAALTFMRNTSKCMPACPCIATV